MSFTNLYYKRTAGTPKPCYVCYKPTPTVLATVNNTDFIYTCTTHLTDPGFARLVEGSGEAVSPKVSQVEVEKVKEEWEERQKKKQEMEKEKKEREQKESKEDNGKKEDKKDSKEKDANAKARTVAPATSPAPTVYVHQKYILHRDMFTLRQAEHRKRKQGAQAKELAPRLPSAPGGIL